MKIGTILIAGAAAYGAYRFCKSGHSLPFGLGAPVAKKPIMDEMFSNWAALFEKWNILSAQLLTTKSGGGNRASLQRQRVGIQNQMRQTPEYRAAFAACKERADATAFGQPFIRPGTLQCDVIVTPPSFEGGAE